jgi:HD-like signal output (HDOD) protein
MRDQRNPGDPGDDGSPDDLARAVLSLLVDEHPAQLSFDELVREMGKEPFLVTDAVDDLVAAGLLHRHGDFVFATRAAVRCDALA